MILFVIIYSCYKVELLMNEWLKRDGVHAYSGILFCHKVETLMHVLIWMSPEDSQSE